MRKIDAGDIQRLISAMDSEGLDPKTIRNSVGNSEPDLECCSRTEIRGCDASKTEAAAQTEKETEIFHPRRSQQNRYGFSG